MNDMFAGIFSNIRNFHCAIDSLGSDYRVVTMARNLPFQTSLTALTFEGMERSGESKIEKAII